MKFKPSYKMKIDNIHEYNSKVNRGVGTVKPKKGKDSYKRKPKYKRDMFL